MAGPITVYENPFVIDPAATTRTNERHEEFVTLLTSAHEKLLGYLLSLLGRWHDAQDVLQSSSLLMWRKFETYDSGSNFIAWASTICFFEAKNFQRLAARSSLKFDDDLLETLAVERIVDLDLQGRRVAALEKCLNEVRPSDRELLRAAYSEHGGISRLAAKLDRAPRTLFNKLNLLRRRLIECVQRRLGEETA